jgi:hypothetical protein
MALSGTQPPYIKKKIKESLLFKDEMLLSIELSSNRPNIIYATHQSLTTSWTFGILTFSFRILILVVASNYQKPWFSTIALTGLPLPHSITIDAFQKINTTKGSSNIITPECQNVT